MWVLAAEPQSSARAQVLMAAEPSLLPPPLSAFVCFVRTAIGAPWHTSGEQKKTWWSQFSPSTWVPRIKARAAGLAVVRLPAKPSPAPWSLFLMAAFAFLSSCWPGLPAALPAPLVYLSRPVPPLTDPVALIGAPGFKVSLPPGLRF